VDQSVTSETREEAAAGAEPEEARALMARGWFRAACFAVAAAITALIIRMGFAGVPDPDSFYHFRHAALYAERGVTMSAFPWLVYSVISRYASDVGYGFHLLLVPFTLARDPVLGVELAAAFEIALIMVLFYWVMRRHAIAYAFAWPYLLVFFAPAIVYTVMQTRPQTLTMGFAALLLSFLLSGSPWGVFAASGALTFFHLNAAAVVPAVVAVTAGVQGTVERRWEWRKWAAAALGVGVGLALRPNIIGTVRLLYVQTVVHEVVRQRHLPLLFGREWSPMSPAAAAGFSYFLLIWAAMIVVFLVAVGRKALAKEDRTFLWTSLLLSVACLAAAMLVTKRMVPLWAAFSVMFAAKTFSSLLDPRDRRPGRLLGDDARLIAALSLGVLLVVMMGSGVNQVALQRRWGGGRGERLRAAAEWIGSHGRKGDIVYNVDWAAFPELFFWNTKQYYVSGLDVIFLYAYDEGLYWKAHHLATGEATARTWGTMEMPAGGGEDTYTALRQDFKASYVVLDRQHDAALYDYLSGDRRYRLGFDDGYSAVFAVRESRE
jgi:hypothetical protein